MGGYMLAFEEIVPLSSEHALKNKQSHKKLSTINSLGKKPLKYCILYNQYNHAFFLMRL